jgi:hypothetical protein
MEVISQPLQAGNAKEPAELEVIEVVKRVAHQRAVLRGVGNGSRTLWRDRVSGDRGLTKRDIQTNAINRQRLGKTADHRMSQAWQETRRRAGLEGRLAARPSARSRSRSSTSDSGHRAPSSKQPA